MADSSAPSPWWNRSGRDGGTDKELQKFLLYCVMVAGKRDEATRKKLETFLPHSDGPGTPFQYICSLVKDRKLGQELRRARIGRYRVLERAFRGVITLDPRVCTLDELESIPGIGPKTSRLFLLKSRVNQRYAVLDTHILKELRHRGVGNVPRSTPPTKRQYARLENAVLSLCDKEGISPSEFDSLAWEKWALGRSRRGSRHPGVVGQGNAMRPTTDYGDIGGKIIIVKDGSEIRTVTKWFDLAPPKKGHDHWVEGRSAFECARAWCPQNADPGVPSEVGEVFASHPHTRGAAVRWATPEHQIRFDRLRGEPRNADIAALADHPTGLVAITIEAKADEPFDNLVRDVLLRAVKDIAEDKRTNLVSRVQQLAASILPPGTANTRSLGELRYQLLTGVAGTLAFAREHKADRAVFIVHEFVTDLTDDAKHKANADDLDAFVTRLTSGAIRSVPAGVLRGPLSISGRPLFEACPPLYLGKALRNCRTAQ
jgi:hypothetical protein